MWAGNGIPIAQISQAWLNLVHTFMECQLLTNSIRINSWFSNKMRKQNWFYNEMKI